MNPENYADLITGYVANTLTPELRHAFEKELEDNPELRKKLAIHEMAQEFVPQKEKIEKEETVTSVEAQKAIEPASSGNWWIFGLILLGVLLIAWLIYR